MLLLQLPFLSICLQEPWEPLPPFFPVCSSYGSDILPSLVPSLLLFAGDVSPLFLHPPSPPASAYCKFSAPLGRCSCITSLWASSLLSLLLDPPSLSLSLLLALPCLSLALSLLLIHPSSLPQKGERERDRQEGGTVNRGDGGRQGWGAIETSPLSPSNVYHLLWPDDDESDYNIYWHLVWVTHGVLNYCLFIIFNHHSTYKRIHEVSKTRRFKVIQAVPQIHHCTFLC